MCESVAVCQIMLFGISDRFNRLGDRDGSAGTFVINPGMSLVSRLTGCPSAQKRIVPAARPSQAGAEGAARASPPLTQSCRDRALAAQYDAWEIGYNIPVLLGALSIAYGFNRPGMGLLPYKRRIKRDDPISMVGP
jgi:hypothetical protein